MPIGLLGLLGLGAVGYLLFSRSRMQKRSRMEPVPTEGLSQNYWYNIAVAEYGGQPDNLTKDAIAQAVMTYAGEGDSQTLEAITFFQDIVPPRTELAGQLVEACPDCIHAAPMPLGDVGENFWFTLAVNMYGGMMLDPQSQDGIASSVMQWAMLSPANATEAIEFFRSVAPPRTDLVNQLTSVMTA